ncbi:ABC transporter permease [Enterococcus sp. LJL99]
MSKQVSTILKKRYFLATLFACLFIFFFTIYPVNRDLSNWHVQKNYYYSSEFVKSFSSNEKDYIYKNDPMYENKSKKERLAQYQRESLFLFQQTKAADENGNYAKEDNIYYSSYLSENYFFLLAIVVGAGFLLFFVDLKTSFNSFLFSLGCSKKIIYWKKYLLVGVPILLSILISKFFYLGIFFSNISKECINISFKQLMLSILANWIMYIFYFCAASFIGLTMGNMILGPLTLIGFTSSWSNFIASVINLKSFISNNNAEYFYPLLTWGITKNPIHFPIIFIFALLSLISLTLGYIVYPKISLEKNGDYLLLDYLRWPVLLIIVFYTTSTIVFSRGYYYYPMFAEAPSVIPVILFYFIITLVVSACIIFQKPIYNFINEKRLQLKK